MICYASRTGTRRNLDALRAAGWDLLVSRAGEWRTEGFARYVLDNGAWSDFQAGRSFDDDAFARLVDQLGGGADWIVLPDIVAGGLASLDLSIRWLNRCLSACPLVLIAVQDGMTEADLAPLVGRSVGIFLGGSTAWKLATMAQYPNPQSLSPGIIAIVAANRWHQVDSDAGISLLTVSPQPTDHVRDGVAPNPDTAT